MTNEEKDMISRKPLIAWLYNMRCPEYIIDAIKDKDRFPNEYPTEKEGHWIHHKEKMFDCVEHWECSHCHRTIMTNPFSADGNDYNTMYYCPKCGTKMAESEE